MSFFAEQFVARRYLGSKRREVFISIITIISVLGVAVSVLVLDMVLAIMTGFEAELKAKMVNVDAHVKIASLSGDLRDWPDIRSKVRAVEGVTDVYPYTYNQAMLNSRGRAQGLLIRGVAPLAGAGDKLEEYLQDGLTLERLFSPVFVPIKRPDGTEDSVRLPPLIVGKALAEQYALAVGDVVTVVSANVTAGPQGLMPRLRRFVVVGRYSSGLIEYEKGLAYTAMEDAQSFFGLGDNVSALEVTVDEVFAAPKIAENIEETLREHSFGYAVSDWTVRNRPLWEALRLEKRVYYIVLLLLILVASFSIVSTMVMIVMEKSRDIAILKVMGAKDGSVLRIFLLQGCIIGGLGTILGSILGFFGCLALREFGFPIDETVFSMKEVPVHMLPENFALVAVSAFVITSLAGVYPAIRASRLNPAAALRYE